MPWHEKDCERCGKPFRAWRGNDRPIPRCCSQQCWTAIHNSPERNTIVARATIEQRAAVIRQRGDESERWYRKVNGKHEHRAVMEQVLGRALSSDEIVHHIDGNKRSNDPSNLQIVTRSEHARIHLPRKGTKKGGDANAAP